MTDTRTDALLPTPEALAAAEKFMDKFPGYSVSAVWHQIAQLLDAFRPAGQGNARPSEDALEPCPFCNSPDVELRESVTDAMIACNNCGCRTGFVYLGASEASNANRIKELRAAWNLRAPHACIKCGFVPVSTD